MFRIDVERTEHMKRQNVAMLAETLDECGQFARVELIDTLYLIAFRRRNRVAGNGNHIVNALGAEPEKDGLDRVEVAVATGHVRNRLDPELTMDTRRKHRRIHTRPRDGVIRNRNRIDPRLAQLTRPTEKFLRVTGLRRVKLYSNDFPAIPQSGEKGALRLYDRLLLSDCLHISSHCALRPERCAESANMRRCRAAAAAEDGDTVLHECRQCLSKILRCTLIEGAPIDDHRMPRVRHQRERQRHRLEMMQQFLHLTYAVDTVEADGINLSALCHGADEILRKEAVARIAPRKCRKGNLHKGMRACRLDIGGRFRQPLSRGIRLKEEMRGTAGKECIRQKAILRSNVARRQSDHRTDISKDVCAKWLCRACGERPAGTDNLRNEFVVALVDNAVCGKCIRLDRLRTGMQVLCMNPCNHVGRLEVSEFHALAACIGFLCVVRAHTAVKDERLML